MLWKDVTNGAGFQFPNFERKKLTNFYENDINILLNLTNLVKT